MKIFGRNKNPASESQEPLQSMAQISIQPTEQPPPAVFINKSFTGVKDRLKMWFMQNKKQAIGLLVLLIILISGGVYALVANFNKPSNISTSPNTSTSSNAASSSSNKKSNNKSSTNSSTASSSSTSSSSSGSTSGPGASSFTAPIGFVGCSNSRDTVLGYRADGGTKMWVPTTNTYGGGTVVSWQTDAQYFGQFDQFLTQNPTTKVVWWSLCTHPPTKNNETDAANYSAALYIISTLKAKIPGVTIYASALNTYVAPHVCSVTGADGPARMQSLVNRLVSEGRVKTGPVVGSLLSWEVDGGTNNSAGATEANDQTKSDGCHPNTLGEAHLGQSLVNFFGK